MKEPIQSVYLENQGMQPDMKIGQRWSMKEQGKLQIVEISF